jgi:G3E family GTPase
LIINEFGSLGVDGALVEKRDLKRYEINKGSIFCICTKTDFLKALTEIAANGHHAALLIEATGIAETCDIESFLEAPHLADAFEIAGNLCLVDAVDFTRVAAFLKPAKTQVYAADLLIINKCDRVNKAHRTRLRQLLQTLNPGAIQIETEYGKINPVVLNEIQHRTYLSKTMDAPPVDIMAVSITTDRPFDRSKFYAALEELKDKILRLKGNIEFESGVRFIEGIGPMVTEGHACRELANQNGNPSAFTVIAWQIDKGWLQERLLSCVWKKNEDHGCPGLI